ncbi:MAG: hypothetical protein LJE94_18930 [Deltaproteobacteria bacterium]|jgi:hypothetical protein|nr:hypothetical protein [Deltaproteobacteria bacterium]
MPYLKITSRFPSDTGPAAAEKHLEVLSKFPHDESISIETVPAAVRMTHKGVKSFSISEVKDGKLDAAYSRAVKMMAMFIGIKGFEYTIEIYSKIDEAMATMGMEMP